MDDSCFSMECFAVLLLTVNYRMKRMRYWFITCLLSFMAVCVSAQQPVGEAESRKMVAEVCAAAAEMSSLQCDFVQVKQLSLLQTALTSKGRMYYKGGDRLRWEYTSPYTYTFVLNKDRVMMKSAEKTDIVSVRSSRMFQQIARIMLNSVTGRCLADDGDFEVTMYGGKTEWEARLVPRQKELAALFSEVRLHIDPKLRMVTIVELKEKSGDNTRIEMKNVRKNETIGDAVFTVR